VIATPDLLDVADNVPQALPAQPAPESAQVTPPFLESRLTVAVKLCLPMLACAFALVGDTLTVIRDWALVPGAVAKIQTQKVIRIAELDFQDRKRCGEKASIKFPQEKESDCQR
jgi:hypothetical protein